MTEDKKYDLVIIGGGPGGYTAAVRASQLGMTVACVEKHSRLGGVCLNAGCIPSKALLDSSELYVAASRRLADYGVRAENVSFDVSVMMQRKHRIVEALTGQVRKLLEAGRVEIVTGVAELVDAHHVRVSGVSGEIRNLNTNFILLATGSRPVSLPDGDFDGHHIVDSTGALEFSEVPQHLGVIGGGFIGLELGSVWQRLGSRVTVIEMLPQIASGLDGQISRALKRSLDKQGMAFRLKTRVNRVEISANGVNVAVVSGAAEETLTFDKLLVAVGRKPQTHGIGLESVGIERDGHDAVRINSRFQTNIASIYAAGDIVAGPMLAHKASAEGVAAVENMAGMASEVHYDTLPSVIYTNPEVASVGLTEDQVKERNIPYRAGTFPFTGNGRALCAGDTEGLVKVIAHAKTDRILGIHMIGHGASEMIAEGVMAMEMGASSEDIARTVHSHPTFSETLMEAAASIQRQMSKKS